MPPYQTEEPQPHLWDGTPMAAMQYVISKGNDTPDHRVYEGMNMSKSEELASQLVRQWHDDALNYDTALNAADELRSLSAINAELLEALKGLDDAYCRAGSPLSRDERTEDRKRLIAARAAIAKARGEQL